MVLPVDEHGRMAAVERQIESVVALGHDVDVLRVQGRRGLKYVQALPHLLRGGRRADVVHAHYGLCGLLARASFAAPLVVSFMGSDLLGTAGADARATPLSRAVVGLDKILARIADAVIVKSEEMALLVAPVDAHVIPNGVDLGIFAPMSLEEARRRLGWEDGYVALFPGCVSEVRKGFALASSVAEHASATLGEPVRLFPLCDVPAAEVPLVMNASDALLMTSFWEGSPNAVKEAMACDVPVVSVPVGDVERLLHGVSGCAVREREPEALADALVEILRERPRSEGRDALRRHGLDLESVARRVGAVYESVLRTSPVAATAYG
jgi:glycosyltransferase involved in cell wall biosynthesis